MNTSEASVLLIGFNRPDLLSQSLSKLRGSKRRIYISVDGPRNDRDLSLVNETKDIARRFEQDQADFGKVKLLLHESNLGCKFAVQSAIDWIFDSEKKAIILEDDIFFTDEFLETMDAWLIRYENQMEIFHLNGFNPLAKKNESADAYLCRYTHVWGWATWKDRWIHYDRDLQLWDPATFRTLPGLIGQDLPDHFFTYWGAQIDLCLNGLDTWDIQWAFSQWVYGGYSLTPGSRLTGNQGFDSRATHTQKSGNRLRERLPDDNKNRFLSPTSPYLNLDLNNLHDEIEHGILPKNSHLTSFKWQFKAFLARFYLRLLSNSILRSILNSLFSLWDFLKKFLKISAIAQGFVSKSIGFFYWRILRAPIKMTYWFVIKSLKYVYWRIVRLRILKILNLIKKSCKFAYWRGFKSLINRKSS